MRFAIGKICVDLIHHLHHVTRNQLLRIFVARPILNVAEVALDAQRRAHCAHHRAHFLGFEDFQVLGSTPAFFLRWILWSRGKQKKGNGNEQNR